MPFLAILAVGVLLIAYVPSLTTWPHDEQGSSSRVSFEDELLESEGSGGDKAEDASGNALPLGKLDLGALLSEEPVVGDDDSASDDEAR